MVVINPSMADDNESIDSEFVNYMSHNTEVDSTVPVTDDELEDPENELEDPENELGFPERVDLESVDPEFVNFFPAEPYMIHNTEADSTVLSLVSLDIQVNYPDKVTSLCNRFYTVDNLKLRLHKNAYLAIEYAFDVGDRCPLPLFIYLKDDE